MITDDLNVLHKRRTAWSGAGPLLVVAVVRDYCANPYMLCVMCLSRRFVFCMLEQSAEAECSAAHNGASRITEQCMCGLRTSLTRKCPF